MAKDLPYFKFFCSEWNDGDVTLEDYKYQGLFINVCSYYWSNECDISLEKLYKRFRHSKEDIDYLFKVELIHKIEGFLSIKFLDEQKEERIQISKKNSNAGKVSAERRRLAKLQQNSNEKSTSVEITLNEKSTIKRREEKKRKEEKNIYRKFGHLKISKEEFDKLNITYSKTQIDDILDRIENYKLNTKYKILYLTANAWLKKEHPHLKTKENKEEGGMTEWEMHQAKVKLVREQAMRGE